MAFIVDIHDIDTSTKTGSTCYDDHYQLYMQNQPAILRCAAVIKIIYIGGRTYVITTHAHSIQLVQWAVPSLNSDL